MRWCVLDRRWRWEHKLITGRYNLRLSDATIREDTKKTYRELLEIVLKALGETDYLIDIPDESLEAPQVDWMKQRADLQLAWLCDRIGCLITLGLDNKVSIIQNGKGPIYPPNGLELVPFFDTTPTAWPKKTVATFAPTRFQMKVKLEAVGLEATGGVYPINDLEYAPGNWDEQVPGIFNDVLDETDRELARQTVYRWYRIKEFAGDTLSLPADYSITTIEDILPLHTGLVDNDVANNYPQRPVLEGRFFNSDLTGLNEQEGEFSRFDDEFEVDYEQGIVKLPYPVYKVKDDGHQEPAELFLTCSFCARKGPTEGWWNKDVEWEIANSLGKEGDVVQVEQADVFHFVVQEYNQDAPSTVTDNKSVIDAMGESLAKSYAKHWENIPKMSMEWNGIITYPVTGNLHMMRWRVGGGPPVTWGGKNVEYRYMSPSYRERKLRLEVSRRLHL